MPSKAERESIHRTGTDASSAIWFEVRSQPVQPRIQHLETRLCHPVLLGFATLSTNPLISAA
jgi:hypothetical protein